jgi:hypothetical protein
MQRSEHFYPGVSAATDVDGPAAHFQLRPDCSPIDGGRHCTA